MTEKTLTGSRVTIAGKLDGDGTVLRVKGALALVRWDVDGEEAWVEIRHLVLAE